MYPFSLESCDHEISCNFGNLFRRSNFSGWNLCRRSICLSCLRTGTTTCPDAAVCSPDIPSPEALAKRGNASRSIPGAFGRGEEREESVRAGECIAVRDGEGVAGFSDRRIDVRRNGGLHRIRESPRPDESRRKNGPIFRLASGHRRAMHGADGVRIGGLNTIKYWVII